LPAEKFPRLRKLWADRKYRNRALVAWMAPEVRNGMNVKDYTECHKVFMLLKRSWVIKRTFAWLARYRRNSKGYERSTASREAVIQISAIHIIIRWPRPDLLKPPPFHYPKKTRKAVCFLLG
jgi:transposase